jgi:hypothetical protein
MAENVALPLRAEKQSPARAPAFGASRYASTLLVTHPAALAHDMGSTHVERPERLSRYSARAGRRARGPLRVEALAPWGVLRPHSSEHLAVRENHFRGICAHGPDVAMNETHVSVAPRRALAAVDAVMRRRQERLLSPRWPAIMTRDVPMGLLFQ